MRNLPRTNEKTSNRQVDPDYAPTVEIFDNVAHQEIHDGVQLLNPGVLDAGKQSWQGSSTGLATAVEAAHTEIRAAFADGWRGSAAQTAADAVRAFEHDGQQLADVMAAVAQRLGQAGDAAEALRAAVTKPAGTEPDLAAALLDPSRATENAGMQKAVENSRQDVVQAMDSIYTNAFISSGSGIPAFPDSIADSAAAAPIAAAGGAVAAAGQVDSGTGTLATQVVSSSAPPQGLVETTQASTVASASGSTAPASVTQVGSAESTPVAARTIAAAADSPVSTTTSPSAATNPVTDRPGPAGSRATGPATFAAAAPVVAPTIPGAGQVNSDDERKRDDKRRDAGSDAVTGAGAGMMGGLMGGALAAADTPRPGPSVAARAVPQYDDEDDDYHFVDDELTFLEPADDGGELIGAMDPTTPPVVGEWTELE